ncbi:MAG: DUF3570 domain-containing protein [Deltaproteobacteria bacterium]|nr:DUF3570 domain-containing protein [Deltaproteobacteria bacterium]
MTRARTALCVAALGALVLVSSGARADGRASASTTLFLEPGTGTTVTNITPQVDLSQNLGDDVTLSVGYEADIVSGATERLVDAPGIDVVTGASFDDIRHSVRGGFEIRHDVASLAGSYTFGTESDYQSHAFSLTAAAELFDRNTRLELSYARAFDRVCNLSQPRATEAVERQALDSSDGCFTENTARTTNDLALHNFQLSWTQAWTSTLAVQLTATANLAHGFQTNPYRAIWLGRGGAQEHAPEDRARYALGVRVNWWLRPIRGAVQLAGRIYRDTWDVESFTVEVAYEQHLGSLFRLRARGRYYGQSAAAFYSDDYGREPRGQYFVGDRELSELTSILVGGRFAFVPESDDEGHVLGFLAGLELVARFDWLIRDYANFRLSGLEPTDTQAFVISGGIEAGW